MKFIMINKSYQYGSDDGRFILTASDEQVCTVVTAFHCRDKYEWRRDWLIRDNLTNRMYRKHTLAEAKRFCREIVDIT